MILRPCRRKGGGETGGLPEACLGMDGNVKQITTAGNQTYVLLFVTGIIMVYLVTIMVVLLVSVEASI